MFQGNFVTLDEDVNRDIPAAYHQQFTLVNSPADSNLSEDQISIKSMNQFTSEPNEFEESSYQNFERTYEDVDSGYPDSVCQLTEQYGGQSGSQNDSGNEIASCNGYSRCDGYDAFGFDGTTYANGYSENCGYVNGYSERQSTRLPEVKVEDVEQFVHDHFDLEQMVSQQLLEQQPVDQPSQHRSSDQQSSAVEQRPVSVKLELFATAPAKQVSAFNSPAKLAAGNQSTAGNPLDPEKRIPRPANAFMIYGKQNRKILAHKFPQYTNKQISKMLGDEWRRMEAEEKSHFHRLADEAYTTHMQKYPGYYYSPLEARLRKANRKKKHNEKINSKRGYCKQPASSSNPATNRTNGDANRSIQLSQSAAFPNAIAFGELNKAANEGSPQTKYPKHQQTSENAAYQNSKQPSNCSSICAPPIVNGQSLSCQRANTQSNALQHSIAYQANSSHHSNQLRQTSKFDSNRFAPSQPDDQPPPSHSIQPNRNVLFCSRTVQSNVMQLINMPNAGESDLMDNNRFFSQNNFGNNPFNAPLYHHYASSGYPSPTVFHVTSKDPNLNSTLPTADTAFANLQVSNLSNSLGNISTDNTSMNLNQMSTTNNFILANQFIIEQQLYQQQQLAQKYYGQADGGSLSSYLPQFDNPANSTTYSASH